MAGLLVGAIPDLYCAVAPVSIVLTQSPGNFVFGRDFVQVDTMLVAPFRFLPVPQPSFCNGRRM